MCCCRGRRKILYRSLPIAKTTAVTEARAFQKFKFRLMNNPAAHAEHHKTMSPKRTPDDGSNLRSLDQLKNLNSVKDIDEQLGVALRLCNHAHRSDMILRWLLTKLTEPQYATKITSWRLFTQCVRLLQPSLLNARLKTVDVLALITSALAQSALPAFFNALYDTLRTLLAINQQIIAASTATVSEFFAEWLRHLNSARLGSDIDVAEVFLTGQQIWDLRRDVDDTPFVEHCLLPAASLLAGLRSTHHTNRRKRARNSTHDRISTVLLLERLIAKHVFIKSRASFFRTKEQHSSTKPADLLNSQLEALGNRVQKHLNEPSVQTIYSALLNVAIRCGTITRQRQALAEITWYDAVFSELSAQVITLFPKADVGGIIGDMLSMMKERSTLSLAMLRDVVTKHAALDSQTPAWSIVQLVTSMNTSTFTEKSYFHTLASALEQAPSGHDDLRQTVIEPLIDSLAQARRLLEFVSLWQERLEQSDSREDSIWTRLDDILEERLEQNLTAQQVVSAFKARCDDMQQLVERQSIPASAELQDVAARCHVLSAFLRGVHGAELEDAILPDANGLFAQLQTIAKAAAVLPSFWRLALRLLEICGPRWVLSPSVPPACTPGEVVRSSLVKYAMKRAKHSSSSDQDVQVVVFLGKVVQLYVADEGASAAITKLFGELVDHANQHVPHLLARYPSLFTLLDSQQRTDTQRALSHQDTVVTAALYEAAMSASPAVARQFDDAGQNSSAHSFLHSAESLDRLQRSQNRRQHAEEVAKALMSAMKPESTVEDAQLHGLIATLLGIELIVEHRSYLKQNEIVKLCQGTSKLALDNTAFQQALSLINVATHKSIKLESHTTDADSLAKQMAIIVTEVFERIDKDVPPQVTVSNLTVLTSVLTASIDAKLAIREHGTFQAIVRQVCSTVWKFLDKTQRATKQPQPNLARDVVLSSYLHAARQALAALGGQQSTVKEVSAIQKVAALIMTETTPNTEDGLSARPLAHPAVKAYEVLCSSSSPDVVLLAHAASRLLSAPFTFADKAGIKQSYGQLATAISTASRLLVVQSLLAKEDEEISAADLIILQRTLETQQKMTLQPEELTTLTGSLLQITVLTRHGKALVSQAALRCLSHIIRYNGYLLNQHAVDEALNVVQSLAKPGQAEIIIFPELCNIMTALLLAQRARLNNRFHIVLPALQALLRRLLAPVPRIAGPVFKLTSRYAHSYARVLTLLCDPPQQKRRPNEQINLVDEARRVRAYVGSFVPVLVHSYCALVLKTPPRPDIKQALAPGLWSAMTAMETGEPECMSILGAAMNDSERSVLRTLVDEWRAGTKRSAR